MTREEVIERAISCAREAENYGKAFAPGQAEAFARVGTLYLEIARTMSSPRPPLVTGSLNVKS